MEVDENRNYPDLSVLLKEKVITLKEKCRLLGLKVGGTKHELALRIVGNTPQNIATSSQPADEKEWNQVLTPKDYIKETSKYIWKTDLRQLPPLNFAQLYQYLVLRTGKYQQGKLSGTEYKVLRAFKFFKAGKVKKIALSSKDTKTVLRCQVEASMCVKINRTVFVLLRSRDGDVLQAACSCPAGLGVLGLSKCNHVAAVLFAVEDFHKKGLGDLPQAISCTSRLSQWVVPKRSGIAPKPLSEINFEKVRYGKDTKRKAGLNIYDPRATAQRGCNKQKKTAFFKQLGMITPDAYLLLTDENTRDQYRFPEPYQQQTSSDLVIIDSQCEAVPDTGFQTSESSSREDEYAFNDTYDLSCREFVEMMECYAVDNCLATCEEIQSLEKATKGQSENPTWFKARQQKITASNFGRLVSRKKTPENVLYNLMYHKQKKTPRACLFGLNNENNAVEAYQKYMAENKKEVGVKEVGLLIAKTRKYYAASLDRLVHEVGSKEQGALEVKCPESKQGMDYVDAAKDKTFCLTIIDDKVMLKKKSNYYVQVQGQMFVADLPWCDFVVWFGRDSRLFVQRIYFDKEEWDRKYLPALDHFYKTAWLPEIFTGRVKRGLPLFPNGAWVPFSAKS